MCIRDSHRRSTVATAASLLRGVGQTTQRLPSNSSGLAASGPTRSVPAIGWQATNAPGRSFGSTEAIARELDKAALVFDVGSVKSAAIASVEPKLRPGAYVACHPIAGTERVGPDAASPLLFEGKRCVICPTPRSNEQNVAVVERLWTAMGAEPVRMNAQLHDRVFGASSHLPHVAAYALAAALGQLAPDVIEGIQRLPTSSLRDTTRVAASSPAMWRDILLDNRAEVVPLIEALAGCVQELRAAVAAGDADRIEKLLVAGKTGRDRFIGG